MPVSITANLCVIKVTSNANMNTSITAILINRYIISGCIIILITAIIMRANIIKEPIIRAALLLYNGTNIIDLDNLCLSKERYLIEYRQPAATTTVVRIIINLEVIPSISIVIS